MPIVKFDHKPNEFRLMPEGRQTLQITRVDGKPRHNVTYVEVDFVNADGITMKNRYDLTSPGAYAAFYYLVERGCGYELEGEFDIDALVGKFVEVEIVHREGAKMREDGTYPVFANIKNTIGPGEPFSTDVDLW